MNSPHPDETTTVVVLRFDQGQVVEIHELVRRHWARMLALAKAFRRRHRGREVDYADDDAANDAAFALGEQAKAGRLASIGDEIRLWRRSASILERTVLLAKHRTMRRRRGGAGVHRAGLKAPLVKEWQ
ncbi:MAG TPA: hypothetical protein VFF52_00320 [Isosphaeraceae bacterium]|nr:hypothetical protein [Isosphaeraceae bacterium]